MIFVRDKGQMCNNILQYAHVFAWARENHRHCMSMRFAYKYQFFKICDTKNHNFLMYLVGKYGAKYKILPTVTYGLIETDVKEKEEFTLSHHNLVIEGWGVRHYDLFLKYKSEILELFDFKNEIHNKVDKIISNTSDEDTIKIGVHIRRGDYKTFFNGIYYFYDYSFLHYIRQTISLFPNKKFTVYICSNDSNLKKDVYIKGIPEVKFIFPDGNAGEDLCLLSKCDYLIGPPSSYSLVAAMYGRAKLHWMIKDKNSLRIESFKTFEELFTTFDNYWANPPKPRKKVLFLISRFLDGGIDTVLVEYLNNLCNLTNHQVALAIMLKMPEYEVFTNRLPENIKTYYFIQNKFLTWYKRRKISNKKTSYNFIDEILINPLRRLLTTIKLRLLTKKYDIIIDFDSTFGSFINCSYKSKKICFFHFSFAKELERDPMHMKRRIKNMEKYDYVVTLSDEMQKEALEMFPNLHNKLIRIYNSVDLNRITIQAKEEVLDSHINEQFLLAVERLEETQKDLTSLIDAYWELTQRNIPNLPKLFIIGEGKSRSIIEEQIQKLELEEKVILLGFIENPYPWMAKAQAIVHSSKFEGLPTVLIEALMLDKLIISSDCPTGPAEILKNGKAGLLVPVGDTIGFADAIERVITDTSLQETLHTELRKHRELFMAENSISALEQLF